MATMQQIEELGREIGCAFQADRVLLFGSHARGTATRDSDVDLLVVLSFQGKPAEKSAEIRLRVRPPFPVDLLVRTPEKIRERIALGDHFMREILDEGKILYESHDG